MTKRIIKTSNAPAPIGPYNQAVIAGNMMFISGQIAINPETGELQNATIAEETTRVMKNIKAILEEASADFSNVVKTSIFLSDMALFSEVSAIYSGFFISDFPARETLAVRGLPKNVNVEISMIALL